MACRYSAGRAAGRCDRMALLGADGLRTIDQPARPDAFDTRRLTIEQAKPLRAPAAPRAYEQRPKAAAGSAQRPDADLVFDPIVAEPDARRLRVPLDVAQRHQSRRANHRQIVDRALHEREELIALDTCV